MERAPLVDEYDNEEDSDEDMQEAAEGSPAATAAAERGLGRFTLVKAYVCAPYVF